MTIIHGNHGDRFVERGWGSRIFHFKKGGLKICCLCFVLLEEGARRRFEKYSEAGFSLERWPSPQYWHRVIKIDGGQRGEFFSGHFLHPVKCWGMPGRRTGLLEQGQGRPHLATPRWQTLANVRSLHDAVNFKDNIFKLVRDCKNSNLLSSAALEFCEIRVALLWISPFYHSPGNLGKAFWFKLF